MNQPFSRIPKVDTILGWGETERLRERFPRPVVVEAIRRALQQCRELAAAGKLEAGDLSRERLLSRILSILEERERFSLRRVVNGTGVVIHTNLGRAPLAPSIRDHIMDVATSYSTLEFDLQRGERGSRYSHVESLLCDLTGAESAMVVNNNAAAVLLVLSALAAGRRVIVSRGELVEIGGSFRIPDVMQQGGAILHEVGTTNRTHAADYRRAIDNETALLLKVHCSNYRIMGFTASVSVEELSRISRENGVPLMVDAGSGNLLKWEGVRGMDEPRIQDYLSGGADIVTFSGDKLLGGAQGGVIVGKAHLLDRLKRHPLLRAIRVDKLTLAAIEGTLKLYRDERRAWSEIPVLRLISRSEEDIGKSAKRAIRRLSRQLPPTVQLRLVQGESQIGGGAMPLVTLPTFLVSVRVDGLSPQLVEQRLRTQPVPIIGRISRGEYLLDFRTIEERDIPDIASALSTLVKG